MSTDSTGADQAYNLYNLHPLLDLLSSALGLGSIKENANVTFFNGYSGKVKVNEADNERQLTINIKTSAKSWDTSDGAISKGMLFMFNDSNLGEYLQGKVSPFITAITKTIVDPNKGDTKNNIPATAFPMVGLVLKTYQSDINTNWVNTEWINGETGINAITAIDTSGGSFTLDTLNLAKKYIQCLTVLLSVTDHITHGFKPYIQVAG